MPNTFNANLTCDVCCDVGLSNLCQILAPTKNFWSECSPDPMCPGREIQVAVGTAGSNAQENPTDFEIGDTTLTAIAVQPVHINKSFHITNADYEKCFRLEKLAAINSDLFGQAIWNKINPLLTNTNFPLIVADAAASWGPDSLKKVYAQLKCSSKHLILDPALYASVMFSTAGGCCFPLTQDSGPGAYGFQSISEHTYWANAPAGTLGFAFCPAAIIFASGIPPMPPACGSIIESRNFTVPGVGLTAQFNVWCSSKSRTLWASYDVIVGVAPGPSCNGVRIVPGGTEILAEEGSRTAAKSR
jgi:hypothetical protein